jgi:hypothetical protein
VSERIRPLTARGAPGLHLKHRDGFACCDPYQCNPEALTEDKALVTCDLCRLAGEYARRYYASGELAASRGHGRG